MDILSFIEEIVYRYADYMSDVFIDDKHGPFLCEKQIIIYNSAVFEMISHLDFQILYLSSKISSYNKKRTKDYITCLMLYFRLADSNNMKQHMLTLCAKQKIWFFNEIDTFMLYIKV